MKRFAKGITVGALATIALLIAAGLVVVLSGAYNVAADERHWPLTEWALHTTMTNSVQGRAEDLTAPAFTPQMVAAGAGEYKAMCQHCHGGAGQSREGWAQGMRPMPPALAGAAREWTPEEVFWLVKHGVKASGMPAFGGTHDDETIWNISAFVQALPGMNSEEYAGFASDHHNSDEHTH